MSFQSITCVYQLKDKSSSIQNDESLTNEHRSLKLPKHDTMTTDFLIPCPFIAKYCPTCCWCCILPRALRQQFALSILYSRLYLIVYFLIVAITLTLLIYDLTQTHHLFRGDFVNVINVIKHVPMWFIILDICCVFLMIIDIILQVQAHHRRYWKSLLNFFDFLVVSLCVLCIPIYFFVDFTGFILPIIFCLRFLVRLLRIVVVFKTSKK
eukprot:UN00155